MDPPVERNGLLPVMFFMIWQEVKPLRTLSGVYPLHAGGAPRPQEQGFGSGSIGLVTT